MKEALYYKRLDSNVVQCFLCPRNCTISESNLGFCKVRQNKNGKLIALTYGLPCSISVDPIEKKPLYHFFPGSDILSIATVGCNLDCKFCQNVTISKHKKLTGKQMSPQQVIDLTLSKNCKSIAFTYTEPTIYYEYMLDIAKLAKANNLHTVMISNGYISKEPLQELTKYIDAFNMDLKGFNEDFYKKLCSAQLKPVLETLELIKETGKWLEVTNLIIPGVNDDKITFVNMCEWIRKNLGKETPLHISQFNPEHKLKNLTQTPEKTLLELHSLAKKILDYVYIGNLAVEKENNTYCPSCNKLLIARAYFGIVSNKIREHKCSCNKIIAGHWE